MHEAEPCMGADGKHTWLFGTGDPQATFSSLEGTQVHPLGFVCTSPRAAWSQSCPPAPQGNGGGEEEKEQKTIKK